LCTRDSEGALPAQGGALEAWGAHGNGEGLFNFQCDGSAHGALAFDAAGNIYVADSGNQRIQKFAPDRTFLTSWGSEGFANGQLYCPIALAVDGEGRVYVSDTAGKIEVFAPDGTSLATWAKESRSPGGLAFDGDGNIWVADAA
jgi:sugar lactone lactonase YvrE